MSVEPRPTGVLRYPFDLRPSDSPAEREDSTENINDEGSKPWPISHGTEIECFVLHPAIDG